MKYALRPVHPEEAMAAAAIEEICFPPSEACTLPIMKERVAMASDSFLVAVEQSRGHMIGFINALCTNEDTLRDELFTDTSLHDPHGKNVMICSVSVLPEYRHQGIARAMMQEFLAWQKKQGKKRAILTCVPEKVSMYASFGFEDRGESESTWGGESWHEMWCEL
ncbi:MAG: GNAT family N-acetyltransferase [Lachnospiraceae bacterium]|nr:GNAT family N-acetyltransferase [Lachnospiraceae bacterium]